MPSPLNKIATKVWVCLKILFLNASHSLVPKFLIISLFIPSLRVNL